MTARTNKNAFATLCEKHPEIPLFSQAWYLDAAAGRENWDVALATRGNEIHAALPYCTRTMFGLRFLGTPPLTKYLGPWFSPMQAKLSKKLAREKDLIEALVAALPRHHLFSQNFFPQSGNGLPWHWQGFEQHYHYTYIIEDMTSEEKLWEAMQSNIRGDIRKAEKRYGLRICSDLGVDELLRICCKSFERQNRTGYPIEVARRIYEACEVHEAGRPFFAVDMDDRVHAASYLVWDKKCAFYLLGGGDPALRNSGAHSLLLWETIRYAKTVSSTFDFEGSMIEPIERFFRAFGARQMSYPHVTRANGRLARTGVLLAKALKALLCG